jgi:prevent-host-death family protein
MSNVGIRDLRNDTAGVLRRVGAGEHVTITSRGVPVATLVPAEPRAARPIPRAELARRLSLVQADPGLHRDLEALAGDTTDDLGPIA